jgi:HSP20 family protein
LRKEKKMMTRWFYDMEPAFTNFSRFRDELDRQFDIGMPLANIRSVPRGTFPPINVQEEKDGVCIQAYVPGVDPKKVEVIFEANALTIKGERETECDTEKDSPAASCHRSERFTGAFSRIVSLPEGLDPEKIEAHCKDGVMKIRIAKMEEKKPKQITVKVE